MRWSVCRLSPPRHQVPLCSASDLHCVERQTAGKDSCLERCQGTLLEVERLETSKDEEGLAQIMADYEEFKNPDNLQLVYPNAMRG